jgi:hypothetical protein
MLRAAALRHTATATTTAALVRGAALNAHANALTTALLRRNIGRSTTATAHGAASMSTARVFVLLLAAAAATAAATSAHVTRAVRDLIVTAAGTVPRWPAGQPGATWRAWLTGSRWNTDE